LNHSTTKQLREDLLREEISTSYATRALLQNLAEVRGRVHSRGRSFVTLAYAQSLDGSITTERGRRHRLSGPEAMRFTHALRAAHDAILVGVGTVVADDPELRVRLVEGPDPQPIVVDSRLRTPATAKLLATPGRPLWIATVPPVHGAHASARSDDDGARADDEVRRSRGAHLEARGGRIVDCPALPNGWVDLAALLRQLAADGVAHVMVEGGARIITSLIEARLVDYLIVTVVPQLLGGLPAFSPAVARPAGLGAVARVRSWVDARLGDDLVLGGEITWPPL
jgi:riboflavin biosynthesis pyrimidine reductase